jgi:hypothetical protein
VTHQPIILFRKSLSEEGELEVCHQYFNVVEHRSEVPANSLVIGRYSTLPYYDELEKDLSHSRLINSYSQHKYIANFDYYNDVKEYTPETWFDDNFYTCEDGPFVVKGRTNSRKYNWNKHMFAKNKRAAIDVATVLNDDLHIGCQGIIYRRYVPLKTYEIGLNDLPFTNEWRVFCYQNKILSKGYYWSSASEETIAKAVWDDNATILVKKLISIVSEKVNFYVLDIAQIVDDRWILIEINDGTMSGLSENNSHTLYRNLAHYLM